MKKLLSTIKRNGAELASCSEFFYIQEKKPKDGRTRRVYGGSRLARVGGDGGVSRVIGGDETLGTLDGGVGAILS